jgi:hypothetical protein
LCTSAIAPPAIDDQFVLAGEQPADGGLVRRLTRQQFAARDHGVPETTTTARPAPGAVQVIDADVGVDEQISHGPTRHGPGTVTPIPGVAPQVASRSSSRSR